MAVTRTIGPIHLEDLEPHRFEDLVRQLLYDFRPWRQLEATGRAGADDGFDARGWEMRLPLADAVPIGDGDADDEPPTDEPDLFWLIQCKREKAIGPTKLVAYVDAIPDAERRNLHGLALAAACDFSKKARDAFRTRARELGFAEAQLWGKAEIEDMLFQPKNDHLLFAYFGISLQTRQRTMRLHVRAKLAAKRKAERVLGEHTDVIVRDAADERYPFLDPDTSKERVARGRWRVLRFLGCRHDGLRFLLRRNIAFLSEDGETWDYAEGTNEALPLAQDDPWAEETFAERSERRRRDHELWLNLPEATRAKYEVEISLPYEAVIDIDETGDEVFEGAHILTVAHHSPEGPFHAYGYPDLRSSDGRTLNDDDFEGRRIQVFVRSAK